MKTAILLFLLYGCTNAPKPVTVLPVEVDSAYLVVPGKAVGHTKIDENIQDVLRLLGKPDDGDAAMQKSVAYYYKEGNVLSILSARGTEADTVAYVKQIRVTSSAFKTPDDLHVGSILPVEQYTKTTSYKAGNREITIWDKGDGIAFEADSAKKCIAIIVYSPEAPYQGAYLNIRPNR